MLRNSLYIALCYVRDRRPSLNGMGEEMRQAVIELGMNEPPLVDTQGPEVFITDAGRERLASILEQTV